MKAGDYAGLSAFQFKYGNVGVYVSDDGTKKIYMANNGGYSDSATVGDSYNNIIEQTNLSGNEIYLKVDFLFNTVDSTGNSSYNIDKANFYYSYNGADWKKIGEELSMVYSLTCLLVTAAAFTAMQQKRQAVMRILITLTMSVPTGMHRL